jgi:hypothetical protein
MTEHLHPNDNGDELTLFRNDTLMAGPNNYDRVYEDSPDDSTTNVYGIIADNRRDLYNLGASSGSGTITAVKIYFRCMGTSGSGEYATPAWKLGGVAVNGTQVGSLSTSYTTYSEVMSRPGGGSWAWTDFASLQAGINLMMTNGKNEAHCTQVYVEITYTLAGVQPMLTILGVGV